MNTNDAAYIAGLFDAGGCVTYTQRWEYRKSRDKKYKFWKIRCEISMADESIIRWIYEVLKVGSVRMRKARKPEYKNQWCWTCAHRDAYYVAKLIWPFAQIKLHKLEQIIDHYNPEVDHKNVVSLEDYRNESR